MLQPPHRPPICQDPKDRVIENKAMNVVYCWGTSRPTKEASSAFLRQHTQFGSVSLNLLTATQVCCEELWEEVGIAHGYGVLIGEGVEKA